MRRRQVTLTPAFQRLVAAGPITREAIDAFLAAHSFPLVEGTHVTWVYRGDAQTMALRHWIYGLPSSQPMARLHGTDLWLVTLEIPPRSRVEYKLEKNGELIEDPRNPLRARDPFGANSVVHTPGYEVPDWIGPDPEAREGTLDDHLIDRRRVRVYLPARFRRTRRYPLLVVHDGDDYLRYTGMKTILDNLIHRLEIPDLVVAFTTSEDRLREYANDPGHARWLTEHLVPRLEQLFPLAAKPQGRGLMGASFGAVASMAAAWRAPGFYGRLLLQSGSFTFTDIGKSNHRGPLFDPIVEWMNKFRARPLLVAEKVFLSCGVYESLIYENRSLVPVLQDAGIEVRFVEARDGHNWENWRDRLRDGLSWLFPGPLMLVYE
jgi:enterochelin esterase family protein